MFNYYRRLSDDLKNRFSEKVYKLHLSLPVSCPNRDGTIAMKGCLFCSESGSGEFVASGDLENQIKNEIKRVREKNLKANKFIAYFQNFTHTYGDRFMLKKSYELVALYSEIVVISVGTRADCLDEEWITFFTKLSLQKEIWFEIGVQTIHETTREFLKIGYTRVTLEKWLERLRSTPIKVVAHLIIGLPNETIEMMQQSVRFLNDYHVSGIKFHHFYATYDSQLSTHWQKYRYYTLTEYIETLSKLLTLLSPYCVVHRLQSDPPRDTLLAPKWGASKMSILNTIDRYFLKHHLFQGMNL